MVDIKFETLLMPQNTVATKAKKRKVTYNSDLIVIYARVSTEEQGKSGLGLEAQIAACKRLIEANEQKCLGVFEEVASGAMEPHERPEFSKAFAFAQEHGASLMIAKLDRLSRQVYHISRYLNEPSHPPLIVSDRPNASEFEINILASLAQEERRLISERTKAALAERRKQGMNLGSAGRKAHSKKARKATEDAIERAKDLRKGGFTYQEIADTLNEEGLLTSRKTKWSKQAIFKRITSV